MALQELFEGVFCKRVILERDGFQQTTSDLTKKLAALEISIINCDREKNAIISAAKEGEKQNLWRIGQLEAEKSALQQKYADLLTTINNLVPSETEPYSPNFKRLLDSTQQKLIAYEHKYTKVYISYRARFVGKNPDNAIDMDVKPFFSCGLQDARISGWLAENKCRVKDVSLQYPDKTFDEWCEIACTRIQARLPNPYGYDQDRWGRNEFWEYATETFYGSQDKNLSFDCDSWAILKHVMRMAAGVPEEMLRFVCGTTFDNQGHATNAVYSPSRGFWIHMNSTSRGTDNDDIRQFKRMGDATESLNIKLPWWSSTSKFSYMQMISDAQEAEVKRRVRNKSKENRLLRKIKVSSLKVKL
jgi:hypothetical protein